jgi:DNA-binding response OmpR family regulator
MTKRVMIIDDDKEFLEELHETLNLSGYEMVAVNDAQDALETANRTKPDIILLDLKMPAKSGFQVADEIRHYQQTSHIPIIAMTGFFKDDYLPLMKMCGIKDFLKKPFNPLDVINRIEKELKQD